MKKKLRCYVFVDDAFGPIPIRTLQHPIKEAVEAYMFLPRKIFPKLISKNVNESLKLLLKLDKMNEVSDCYVDGKLEYKYMKEFDTKVITNLEIDEITLCL